MKHSKLSILIRGLIKENPVLVLVLGTCPTLAISTSVSAAIGMGTMLVMSMWHGFTWVNLACGAYMGVLLALENLLGLTTADRRRTPRPLFWLRCALVNFAFGINAMSFSLDLGQMLEVVKGLVRL